MKPIPTFHRHDDDEDDYFSSKPGPLRDTHSEGKVTQVPISWFMILSRILLLFLLALKVSALSQTAPPIAISGW